MSLVDAVLLRRADEQMRDFSWASQPYDSQSHRLKPGQDGERRYCKCGCGESWVEGFPMVVGGRPREFVNQTHWRNHMNAKRRARRATA